MVLKTINHGINELATKFLNISTQINSLRKAEAETCWYMFNMVAIYLHPLVKS